MNSGLRNLLEKVSPQGYAAAFWAYRFMRGSNRELRRIKTLIRQQPHIADVGAHRGLYALLFHLLTRGEATVEMFEPNPDEHEHLLSLTKRYPNLRLHPVGLSSASGPATLRIPVFGGSAITSRATLNRIGACGAEGNVDIGVSLSSLDEVARTLDGPLDFIKCDVEGHELDVLRGAIRTLRTDRPIVFVEIEHRHSGANFLATFELLDQLDYAGFFFQDGVTHPVEEFDLGEHQRLPALSPGFESRRLPENYVRDFLFVPREVPPAW